MESSKILRSWDEGYTDMELKIFDWNKAARLIVESKVETAKAGLEEDWENTSRIIWFRGIVAEGNTPIESRFATPVVEIDGEKIACYIFDCDLDNWQEKEWPNLARIIVSKNIF